MKYFRSPRISLRCLLGGLFVVGAVLGMYVHKISQRRSAIAEISNWTDTEIVFKHHLDPTGNLIFPDAPVPTDGILATVFGPDRLIDVEHLYVEDEQLADNDLRPLQHLHNIRYLILRCPKLTDASLQYVRGSAHLDQVLIADNSNISEQAVRRAAKRLGLRYRKSKAVPSMIDMSVPRVAYMFVLSR